MARPTTAASPAADATNGRILDTGTAVTSGLRLCGPLHHTVGQAGVLPPGPPGRTWPAGGTGGKSKAAPSDRGFTRWLALPAWMATALTPPREGHPRPIPRRMKGTFTPSVRVKGAFTRGGRRW